MRILGPVALFVAGMLVHWWWATYLTVYGLAPHFLLILTVAIAATAGPVRGECYGFAWGLFLDVIGVRLFGANALTLTLVGYFVGNARRQMDVSSPVSQTMVVALVSFAQLGALALLGLIFERTAMWPGWNGALLLPLVNCLAAPFVFPIVQRATGRA